jgi:hypothetical protein
MTTKILVLQGHRAVPTVANVSGHFPLDQPESRLKCPRFVTPRIEAMFRTPIVDPVFRSRVASGCLRERFKAVVILVQKRPTPDPTQLSVRLSCRSCEAGVS